MKYFGTDGIRGIPNKSLNNELVYKIGRSLKILNCNKVYIATDTRNSKDMLVSSFASGCMSVGINVYYLGVLPTPGLMYYSMIKNGIGVMITASHNPYFYNGIKIVKNGRKLSNEEEINIEKSIENSVDFSNLIGEFFIVENAYKEYINHLLSNTNYYNYKLCIDCANGATYKVAQDVFYRVNKSNKFYAITPDGFNINEGVGSTNIEFIKNRVLEKNYDLGIAFDGDGDRVIFVDNKGNIVDGDKLIYIISLYLKDCNMLKENKVVLSIMSDLGIIKSLKEKDIDIVETPVGDKYIFEQLVLNDLSIGGENSGHIIMKNNCFIGDGIFVALFILKIMDYYKKTIGELLEGVKDYEIFSSNILLNNKDKIVQNIKLINKIEYIKEELNNDCKIIVRPSGTEDLLRVTLITISKENGKYFNELIELIKELDGNE